MEATLLSLRPGQVAEIAARRPMVGGIWQRLKADIERPIAAILILNTAAHTIGASVAGAEFNRIYGEEWIWVFSLVFTFLMLQFTEILPKGFGVRHNRLMAFWIAQPLLILTRVMRPVQALVDFINRPFGRVASGNRRITTSDEITALTRHARLAGEISFEQEQIIKRGTSLAASRVRDVMRPRVDIDALDVETPPEEVLGAVAMSGYSRVPVYEGDVDHIFGFVYIKDLLLAIYTEQPLDVRKLVRPALLVPETLGLDQLLDAFRTEQTQMAVVLDEHGGTEGIVTMEDVLEELVGTIHDEHRSEDVELAQQDENTWLAQGWAGLDHVLEAAGRPELRSEAHSDISTIAGLVQAQLDRIAVAGDRITWNGLTMEVTDVAGPRINRVLIMREAKTENP
jgi:putative hemolysin